MIDPALDLSGLFRGLSAGELDACLQLTKRNGREMEALVGSLLEPGDYTAVRPRPPQLRDDIRVEEVHDRLFKGYRRPPTPASARRHGNLSTRRVGEQQILESGLRRLLQPPPGINSYQHGGLHSSSGDDLRTFCEACLEHLAEVSFRVLHRPTFGSSLQSHVTPDRDLVI